VTDRVDRLLADAGIDAIVTWSPIGVRALTGYWCWIAPLLMGYMVGSDRSEAPAVRSAAVLPSGAQPTLLVDSMWAANAGGLDGLEVRAVGDAGYALDPGRVELAAKLDAVLRVVERRSPNESAFTALGSVLEERGLGESRIGVDLAGADPPEVDQLRELLPRAELLDATSLLRLVRAVKTESEIDALRRAASISESAALPALGAVKAGASTGEIVSRYREAIAAGGADFDHFAFGPAGLGIATEWAVELRDGDALYADFGLVLDGWFADSGTTLAVGPASSVVEHEHAAVRDCIAVGASELRPGVRGSLVQGAMQDALAAEGIIASFPHGHGLGLEVRDYPVIVPDTGLVIRDECIELPYDLELEPGMVVNLEAPLFTLGRRSVHCEQSFVITADGCEPLVPQHRQVPVRAEA
jgi:Xaa-Pro dipeptidase